MNIGSTKAQSIIQEGLKMVDTVIEVLDARAPISSRNIEINNLIKGKNKIIVINKCDLIDKDDIRKIENYFRREQKYSVCLSAKDNISIKRLYHMLDEIYKNKKERYARRHINALPLKVMIIGIPNVGKSHLINALTGRKIVSVENRPGSTKGQQWINIIPNVQLLDTPGVLWTTTKKEALKKLEMLGNVKINDCEDVATRIIDLIQLKILNQKYNLDVENKEEFLSKLSEKLLESDINRVASILIEDFRTGNIEKILVDNFI